ncbi:MAG: hypothetical protein HZRFUVUK_001583, partial [Candidatus Fervidibacterota bacterium]
DERLNRKTQTMTGKQLAEGIELVAETSPSSLLLIYKAR